MTRPTVAEVAALERRVERLTLNLELEIARADRATKSLRELYQYAELPGLDDGTNPDSVELENEVCAILGYQ